MRVSILAIVALLCANGAVAAPATPDAVTAERPAAVVAACQRLRSSQADRLLIEQYVLAQRATRARLAAGAISGLSPEQATALGRYAAYNVDVTSLLIVLKRVGADRAWMKEFCSAPPETVIDIYTPIP
jgi:hypothetical protein